MRDQLLIIVSPILFLILFSLVYRFSFFQYYLTFLYPLPYLLLGVVFSFWLQKRGIKIYLFLLIFLPGIIINLNKNFTLFSMTSVREELNEVAKSVASHIRPGESFNIVSLRKGSGYYNGVDYRYFLETFYHQKALDWDIIGYQESQVLYFVSHQGEFEPLSSNIWEICLFKPRKIIQRWEVGDNVIVYKLVK